MEDAQAEKDHPDRMAEKLLAVAQGYPNSGVAPQAMLAAADAYEHANQPHAAIRVLRQMWFKYAQQGTSRVQIAEAMARNYLAVTDRNRGGHGQHRRRPARPGGAAPRRPEAVAGHEAARRQGAGGRARPSPRRWRRCGRSTARRRTRRCPTSACPSRRPPAADGRRRQVPQAVPEPDQARWAGAGRRRHRPAGRVGAGAAARDFARADRVVAWAAGAVSIFAAGQDNARRPPPRRSPAPATATPTPPAASPGSATPPWSGAPTGSSRIDCQHRQGRLGDRPDPARHPGGRPHQRRRRHRRRRRQPQRQST